MWLSQQSTCLALPGFDPQVKLGLAPQTYISSPQHVEVGGSEVQGHPQLHSKSKASLGYKRLSQSKHANKQSQIGC